MSRISNLVKKAENKISHGANVFLDDLGVPNSYIMGPPGSDVAPQGESVLSRLNDQFKQDVRAANKGIKNVGDSVKAGVDKAGNIIKFEAQHLPDQLKQAGNVIEQGALSVGQTLSTLESDLLPSSNKIIMESALAVGAIAIIGILVFRFA
jgi:hypothetical protein